MSFEFVHFDEIRKHVVTAFENIERLPDAALPLYLVCDLFGKVRMCVPQAAEADAACREALRTLATDLHEKLGAHGYSPEDAVLFVDEAALNALEETRLEITGVSQIYWVDRLVTGRSWWTVDEAVSDQGPRRFTLFSVKGGVGRSTTAAVLAWHLAREAERVLVVDLDLESPGLSSAVLEPERQPDFGIVDWFVEDLVEQGDSVAERVLAAPTWSQDLDGDVRVAPAHGKEFGDYLGKLGRVYVEADQPWPERLKRCLGRLEAQFEPTVVLIESRSGLHDIAAATVTDLDADVLLFATDSESNWTGYDILFQHWRSHVLAKNIRERLSIVSALTPEIGTPEYLEIFRHRAWDLFRDQLYDELDPSSSTGDEFSFDLNDEYAPHDPMVINWTRGLSAGVSLRNLDNTAVAQAYSGFLKRFDQFIERNDDR